MVTARISTSDKRFVSLVFFLQHAVILHFTRALCGIFTLTHQMGLRWEWKAAHQKNDNNPNYFEMKSILCFISTMPSMTAWLMSSEKSADPLKCVRRCIHSSRHSAVGWWMERKLGEDVANTAPATCVPLDLFGVFERKLWVSNLQKQENRVEMKWNVCFFGSLSQ